LTGTIPSALGHANELSSLHFSYNSLIGVVPFQLCDLPISAFDFNNNPDLDCYEN